MFVPVLRSETISFKNNTKSVGPSIDPWGTPDRTGNSPELDPPTTTHCYKFIAYNKQTLQFCDALSPSLSAVLAVDQSGCVAVAPGSSHWAVNGRSVPMPAYQSIQPQLLATGRLSMKVCRVS